MNQKMNKTLGSALLITLLALIGCGKNPGVGGTAGDIESLPFLEAIRQVRHEVGRDEAHALFADQPYKVEIIDAVDAGEVARVGESAGLLDEHTMQSCREVVGALCALTVLAVLLAQLLDVGTREGVAVLGVLGVVGHPLRGRVHGGIGALPPVAALRRERALAAVETPDQARQVVA